MRLKKYYQKHKKLKVWSHMKVKNFYIFSSNSKNLHHRASISWVYSFEYENAIKLEAQLNSTTPKNLTIRT